MRRFTLAMQGVFLRACLLPFLLLPLNRESALFAQDTRSIREATRSIARAIEHGEEQRLRARLKGAEGRDPSSALDAATLERLTFHAADAERIYRRLLAETSLPIHAHAAFGLASIFAQSARYRDAVIWFDTAGKYFATLGDSAGQSESFLGRSQGIIRTSGVAESRAALSRAQAFAPSADILIRAYLVCTSLMLRVRAADAVPLPLFQDGRLLAHGVSARAEALCLLAQVELLDGQGDLVAALATLDTLAELQQRAGLTNGLSATRQWQGWILLTRGSYVDARLALEEAIRLGDASGSLSSAGWANNTLAELAQRLGSWSDGAVYARRAEQAFMRAHDGPGLLTARVSSASVALATGDLDRASRSYESLQHDVVALFPRTAVEVFAARSDIARRSNDLTRARGLLDSADFFVRTLGVQGWSNDLTYRRAMIALVAGRFGDARSLLEMVVDGRPTLSPLLRYQLFARLAEVEARDGKLPRSLERMEQALHEMDLWRARLADRGLRLAASQTRAFDWDTDLGFATVVAAVATQVGSEAALSLADKRRAHVLLDESTRRRMFIESGAQSVRTGAFVSHAHVVGEVGSNTAVISYTTGNGGEPTTMIVMAAGRTTSFVITPADSIVDPVRRFVAFLDAGHLARPASRRLAAVLIDPALPLLPATVNRLVIVPDGIIYRIPFAALLLSNDSLLAQRFEIVTAPSVAIALHGLGGASRPADSSPGGPRRGVLAFGAPASLPPAPGSTTGGWELLPGAHDEMHRIARMVDGTEIIEGTSATFSGLRNAAIRPGPVLHLATHARAVQNSLMSGAMLLAPEAQRQRETTAPEIAAMTLPFDLVVLSACESGNGSLFTGEGLQGLATAFLEAGARAVLATRWRLEDRESRAFLDAFYESLTRGRDAAGALADARRLAINRHLSPAIWANFDLIGDPRVAPRISAARTWSRAASILALILLGCLMIYGVRLAVRRRGL